MYKKLSLKAFDIYYFELYKFEEKSDRTIIRYHLSLRYVCILLNLSSDISLNSIYIYYQLACEELSSTIESSTFNCYWLSYSIWLNNLCLYFTVIWFDNNFDFDGRVVLDAFDFVINLLSLDSLIVLTIECISLF